MILTHLPGKAVTFIWLLLIFIWLLLFIVKATNHYSDLLSESCLLKILDLKLKSFSLIFFGSIFWKVEAWDHWPCLNISVKETPVTTVFDDDAHQIDCALKVSVYIPTIEKTCPNHLETVDGDKTLCGLIWLTKNGLSPTPKTMWL